MATTDILTITDGVHQVNLGGTSATLIETGDRPVLIDYWMEMEPQTITV